MNYKEGERSDSPVDPWELKVREGLKILDQLPAALKHQVFSQEVEAANGDLLRCEVIKVNIQECKETGHGAIVRGHPFIKDRYYLIAKNPAGDLEGTYIGALFNFPEGLRFEAGIKVVHKGRGYSTPIARAFIAFLQEVANTEQKEVLWEVANQNLQELEDYRRTADPDPVKLTELEHEQQRWQVVYGTNGKLGLADGKRLFVPEPSS